MANEQRPPGVPCASSPAHVEFDERRGESSFSPLFSERDDGFDFWSVIVGAGSSGGAFTFRTCWHIHNHYDLEGIELALGRLNFFPSLNFVTTFLPARLRAARLKLKAISPGEPDAHRKSQQLAVPSGFA